MKISKIFSLFVFSILFTFCGGQSDQDLFDQASGLLTEKKYDEAIVMFEQIVEKNKDSEIASKALFESAKLYQGLVIKNLNEEESLLKAVEVYKKVHTEYPKSAEAENSLFMSGFILANNLNDLEGAKKTYELFIEQYPDGQLADDAQVELENLGKSPEEILKDKIQEVDPDEKAI